jgi:uncharacterized protein DUF3237
VQLKPLYSVRFRYPQAWNVEIKGPGGVEERNFLFAEGVCTGRLSGRFRGANHPRRRTDHTFEMDLQGFIETEDGATVIFDYKGYGRSYPKGRRQVVGAAKHVSDHEKYSWLNDSICVIAGEVRSPNKPSEEMVQGDVELVFDVSELVWEAPRD